MLAVVGAEREFVDVGVAGLVRVGALLEGDAVTLLAPGHQNRVRDDAAVRVVGVLVVVVAVQYGELRAVDRAELVGGDA